MAYFEPSGFIKLYEKHKSNASYDNIKKDLNLKEIDNETITCLGYTFKIHSCIFRTATSNEILHGWALLMKKSSNEDILRAYIELEFANAFNIEVGNNGFFHPILELLKLCFWIKKCSQIKGFESKFKTISSQIGGKSRILAKFKSVSESGKAYIDLMNSTRDFYSELMFASILKDNGRSIEFNKICDLVVDGINSEVKTIHDRVDIQNLRQDGTFLILENVNKSDDEIRELVVEEISRLKWQDHLKEGLRQRGKLILINSTSSILQEVVLFIENNSLQEENTLVSSWLDRLHDDDVIPILVIFETIYTKFITTFFLFYAPIRQNGDTMDLNSDKFSIEYLRRSLIFR